MAAPKRATLPLILSEESQNGLAILVVERSHRTSCTRDGQRYFIYWFSRCRRHQRLVGMGRAERAVQLAAASVSTVIGIVLVYQYKKRCMQKTPKLGNNLDIGQTVDSAGLGQQRSALACITVAPNGMRV